MLVDAKFWFHYSDIIHINVYTSSEAGWSVDSCIHVCIELNGAERVVTSAPTQTNVVSIVTLTGVNIKKILLYIQVCT